MAKLKIFPKTRGVMAKLKISPKSRGVGYGYRGGGGYGMSYGCTPYMHSIAHPVAPPPRFWRYFQLSHNPTLYFDTENCTITRRKIGEMAIATGSKYLSGVSGFKKKSGEQKKSPFFSRLVVESLQLGTTKKCSDAFGAAIFFDFAISNLEIAKK